MGILPRFDNLSFPLYNVLRLGVASMIRNTGVKLAVIYVREHTEVNTGDKHIQVNHLRNYCNQRSWRIVHTFIDSNGFLFGKMMDYAADPKNNIFAIVCSKVSHIACSFDNLMALTGDLTRKGISLICLNEGIDTGTPQGQALIKVIGDFTRNNENTIHPPNQEAKIYKNGSFTGGVPYGYAVQNGVLVVDTEKAAVINQVFIHKTNGISLQRICDILEQKGIKSARGGSWTKQALSFILKNHAYIGECRNTAKNGTAVQKTPAIISKELFYKINGTD
jgi:site-specific DNA recombinase